LYFAFIKLMLGSPIFLYVLEQLLAEPLEGHLTFLLASQLEAVVELIISVDGAGLGGVRVL